MFLVPSIPELFEDSEVKSGWFLAFFVARLRFGFLRSARSFTTLHLLSSFQFIIMYYCFLWLFSSLPFSLSLKDHAFKRISLYYSCSGVSVRNTNYMLMFNPPFFSSEVQAESKTIPDATHYYSHPILQLPSWFTKVNIALGLVERGPSPGHHILEGSTWLVFWGTNPNRA